MRIAPYAAGAFVACKKTGNPDSPPSGAAETIEKLRKSIAENPAIHEGRKIEVTLTFGISRCNPDESLEDCIHRPDKALYQGKEAGRNRIVTA